MAGYNLKYLILIASMSQFENISGRKMDGQKEQMLQF